MSSGSFKMLPTNYKYMYKQDLALNNPQGLIWYAVNYNQPTKSNLHTVVWFQVFLSRTNNLHTDVWFQVFLSNTNNVHSAVWFQVFLSNTNNLHTVLWFQVFLSNTNNLDTYVWFQVFLSNTNILHKVEWFIYNFHIITIFIPSDRRYENL